MNILLIFDENPEEVKLYYLDNLGDDEVQLLKKAAGKYVNAGEDEAALRVGTRIDTDIWNGMPDEDQVGVWADKQLVGDAISSPGPIDLIIKTGAMV